MQINREGMERISKYQLDKINSLPNLKKKVIRQTICLLLQLEHDFSFRRVIENPDFEQIIKGNLIFQFAEKELIEEINIEFIEVMNEMIIEKLLKINQLGWIVASKNFKRRSFDEVEEDYANYFI